MSAAQNVMASEPQQVQWHYVCETNDLVTNSGVCALVDSQQVAIFSLKINGETQVFAISNYDPIGKANVLYRGLLGSIGGAPVVAGGARYGGSVAHKSGRVAHEGSKA